MTTIPISFQENQQFRIWWIWFLIACVDVLIIYTMYSSIHGEHPDPPPPGLMLIVVLILALVNWLLYTAKLETRIDKDGISYKFFPFIPSFKSVAFEELDKIYVRKYSPIFEYGGWGYRLGLFGKIWMWGTPKNGLTTSYYASGNVLVSNNSNFKAIAAGSRHLLALKADGTVCAVGESKVGQSGIDAGSTAILTKIKDIENLDLVYIKEIAGGDSHSLAVAANGNVWAWGRDNKGQLGSNASVPTPPSTTFYQARKGSDISNIPISNAVNVYAGAEFSIIRRANWKLMTAGADNVYQLGNDVGSSSKNYFVPAESGSLNTIQYQNEGEKK